MKIYSVALATLMFFLVGTAVGQQRPGPDHEYAGEGKLTIQPIRHGTLALAWNDVMIYVDPTGGAEAFEGLSSPDLILITDIHGDHLNTETIGELDTEGAVFVVPQAVADRLPGEYSEQLMVLNNGEETEQMGLPISAIPMYNLPESEDSRHTKGRGNGYVINFEGKRVYISGDTEDIPEMRSLENIDIAFICMNLPYTMDINQAASAVLEFQPAVVYPYHYRGQDTEKFRELVTAENAEIEVRLKDWYME